MRHALYIAATTSVRKASKGKQVNPVIYEYYQQKTATKTKQALGAVMNKLLRIIFSVWKNRQSFRLITPDHQVEMYQKGLRRVA